MAPRKTADPKLIALLDRQQKALASFEKAYSRAKRAFGRMDKLKQQLARIARNIERLQQ